jgi:hypothetical protein
MDVDSEERCLARLVPSASDAKGERLEYNTCIWLAFGWHLPPAYTCQSATIKPRTLRYDMVGNLGKINLAKAEMEGFLSHQGILMHSSSLCCSRLWPNSKTERMLPQSFQSREKTKST